MKKPLSLIKFHTCICLGDLFRVKISLKWAIIPFFRCSKMPGEAGKQEISQQMFQKC